MRHTLLLAAAGLLVPVLAVAAGLDVVINGKVVTLVDVPQTSWFAAYVRQSAEAGIVTGYQDGAGNPTGRFGPADSVTIAQALKIAVEGAGYDADAYARHYVSGVGDHWASKYVSVARAQGFSLFQGSIALDRPATRAEVSRIFADAFMLVTVYQEDAPFRDVESGDEAAAAIAELKAEGVISGDTDAEGNPTGYFRPTSYVNRAETVKIVINSRAHFGTPGEGTDPMPIEEEVRDDTDFFQGSVSFDANGFAPAELRVSVGDTVRFVNSGDAGLWIASDPHPTHTDLPGLDAGHSMLPGEFFQFTFESSGSFHYHNHLNPSQTGTIIVE